MGGRQRRGSAAQEENQKQEAQLFYEEANCHIKAGNIEKAVGSYTKALELNPVDKNSLVARSKCYILLAQPEAGLRDAETALSIDKNFIKAIYQKAESLYYLGDFEHSLMYYHRGLRMRPEHDGFKLGVHKAQKAIENAIGSSCLIPGISTLNARDSIRQRPARGSATAKTNSSPSPKDGSEPGKSLTAKTIRPATAASRQSQAFRPKTAKKSRLLRELGVDKIYLENLINNPDLKCKYKDDDSAILGYIQDAVDFLNTRQEFWRQQLPPHLK